MLTDPEATAVVVVIVAAIEALEVSGTNRASMLIASMPSPAARAMFWPP